VLANEPHLYIRRRKLYQLNIAYNYQKARCQDHEAQKTVPAWVIALANVCDGLSPINNETIL